MAERFKTDIVFEHGQGHYRITDCLTGREIHCDFSELSETMTELQEETFCQIEKSA